jgi:hypothetical protein
MSDHQTIIDQFRRLPDELEALVRPLTDAQLDARPLAGEWTVRQNVHHVADAHTNGILRLKWPLTEDTPTIKTYEQDAFAAMHDYTLPIDNSLVLVRALHVRIVALLESLTEEQWARPVLHPDWGRMTVTDIAKIYGQHGYDHLDQIKKTLAAIE